MTCRRMALLAEQRRPLDEQGGMVAAMRLVANRAVFRGRCVLPQEGPAFFGMAAVTGFIDCGLLEQEVVITVVRVVTIAAGHAAEPQWMVTGLVAVGLSPCVAAETGLLLRQGIEHPVTFPVNLVTGCTGNILYFMRAAEPAQAPFGLVTVEANLVLLRGRRMGGSAKGPHRHFVTAPPLCPCVLFAGAVAGFALQTGKRGIRISPGRMLGLENGRGRLF